MNHYFLTGTSTEVGKTYVAKLLLEFWAKQDLKVAGFKPVAAGAKSSRYGLRNDDAMTLKKASNVKLSYQQVNPFCFSEPASPHIAAAREEAKITVNDLLQHFAKLDVAVDIALYEGAGGWFTPINEQETLADFAKKLNAPVILVVDMQLGCLNHALLTAQAIANAGLIMAGWIANQRSGTMDFFEDNLAYLNEHLPAPLLAVVEANCTTIQPNI